MLCIGLKQFILTSDFYFQIRVVCEKSRMVYFLFFEAKMGNAVVKRYSCNHNELLSDRIDQVGNDIEAFLSSAFMSPAATMYVLLFFFLLSFFCLPNRAQSTDAEAVAATTTTKDERKEFLKRDERTKLDVDLDQHMYNRASTNDFFLNAFGSTTAELKPNQPHSLRSTFEHLAGDFIERRAPGAKKETLADVKEQMRKKQIRIDTKN